MRTSARQGDSRCALASALLLALAFATPALAQSKLETLQQRDRDLDAARSQQKSAAENERKLSLEIDAIGDDRRKLNQSLIDTAARVRVNEDRISETQTRLIPLDTREHDIRLSLDGRRAVIAEVLAALQRMGRSPPPAMMVRPEDALQSVRTAMMLGAVLPEMRQQTEALLADLERLAGVRREIAEEKARLERDVAALEGERQRIALLVGARQKKQEEVEKSLESERQKAVGLSRQADNLKDLIGKMEVGLDAATRAARQANRAAEEKARENRVDLAALKDPGRLTPAVAFASARGHLPLPVNGVRIREFGAPDAIGGTERGLTIATRTGAQVTSPCDGWVVYAGVFRNYGQVLILNAGGGYHVVLAGMDKISVDVGQFVLTGEPVALMGRGSQAAQTLASSSSQSVLYVEFRKDGTPVDPGPWWAASEGEKARG